MKKIKIGSYSRTVTKDGNRKTVEVKRKAVGGTITKKTIKSFQPAVGESSGRYTVDKVKKFKPSNGGEVTVKRKVNSITPSTQYSKTTKRGRSGQLKSNVDYYVDDKSGVESKMASKYNKKGKLVSYIDAYRDSEVDETGSYMNRLGVKKVMSDGKATRLRKPYKK